MNEKYWNEKFEQIRNITALWKSCSMCFGDFYHGRDGYYRKWAESQERDNEQEQEQEQEQDVDIEK